MTGPDQQTSLNLAAPVAAGSTRAHTIARHANTHVPRNTTSRAAGEANSQRRPSQRELVYLYILGQGDRGATRKEIAANMDLSENAVRPRVLELSKQVDPALNHVRVFESGLPVDQRDGCNVLYAGHYAVAAGRRFAESRGPEALRIFDAARKRVA